MTTPADAVLQLIRDAVPEGVPVYDGRVPEWGSSAPPDRYAVLWITNPQLLADTVAHESRSGVLRWQVTSVAPDRGQAAWLAAQIRDALLDVRPQADGWGCGLIRQTYAGQPMTDKQVQQYPKVVVPERYELDVDRRGS